MNIFDRVVTAVAPVTALKRMAARQTMQILNYGYSEGGASGQKKSMRGWRANATSPKDDIDSNLNTLCARSRDLYMNAPLANAALKTIKTNVVGPGLKLKCHIDAERLGISEDQASSMGQEIEREFSLWAESKHCDALKMNDFNDLQGLAFLGAIMNGDSFTLFKYSKPTPWMPYGLRLHVIEGDRVSSPYSSIMVSGNVDAINPITKNRIISGIELDSDGAVIAYHVSNHYAISTGLDSSVPREWMRIEAFGKNTGRPNVLHLMETERAEQRRGVPVLAPVIETLKQLTRYTEAELMASVVAGMFTVFVKTTGPTSEMSLGSMVPEEDQVAPSDPTVYEMANAGINVLGPGESIEIANPGRPNSQFDAFITSLTTQIGASLEIPRELLLKAFTSSYSASRAALLEAYKMFRTRRTWVAKEFNQPVFEEWMDEAVGSGRIKAPGYFNDPAIRRAYLQSEWTGLAPGMLNPSVEVAAAGKRIELGLSTREKETIELTGGDFSRNVKQLAREKALMKESGLLTVVSGEGGRDPVSSQQNIKAELYYNRFKPLNEKNKDKLDEVKRVIKTLSKEEKAELGPRYFYDDAQYRYIVEKDDKSVGFIENRATGKKGHFNIAVDPDYRGQGIADDMVDQAINDAPKNLPDIEKILWVTTSGNKASRDLAEKHGFELTSEDDDEVKYTYWL